MHHVSPSSIGWHVPSSTRDELDLNAVPADDEPGRKFLVEGQSGFYVQAVRVPPNFHAPDHHHDHPEIFMVAKGSCVFNGLTMGPFDLVVVEGGEPYGFISGDEGVQFIVTRNGVAKFIEGTVEEAAGA